MYVEASGRRPGQTAKLESPVFTAITTGETCSVWFAYHMYGAAMGTLNVSVVETGSNTETVLWSLSGNQGNRWYGRVAAIVPSSVTGNYKVSLYLSWESTGCDNDQAREHALKHLPKHLAIRNTQSNICITAVPG